jgi:hypothetical protein
MRKLILLSQYLPSSKIYFSSLPSVKLIEAPKPTGPTVANCLIEDRDKINSTARSSNFFVKGCCGTAQIKALNTAPSIGEVETIAILNEKLSLWYSNMQIKIFYV